MSMAGLAGSGAAKRRIERQLRAWHRHVRMTVAVEPATAPPPQCSTSDAKSGGRTE